MAIADITAPAHRRRPRRAPARPSHRSRHATLIESVGGVVDRPVSHGEPAGHHESVLVAQGKDVDDDNVPVGDLVGAGTSDPGQR